jgi:hypothetical protein
MLKIQHGLAGFFAGMFTGFLLGLLELRIIDRDKHHFLPFFVLSLTIITCAITGLLIGLKLAARKKNKHRRP